MRDTYKTAMDVQTFRTLATYYMIDQLYEYIKHGDEDHQAWLKEALTAFFEGKECPPAR